MDGELYRQPGSSRPNPVPYRKAEMGTTANHLEHRQRRLAGRVYVSIDGSSSFCRGGLRLPEHRGSWRRFEP